MKTASVAVLFFLVSAPAFSRDFDTRGFVDNSQSDNEALIVGVSHGLPGGDSNIRNVEEMVSHPDYRFHHESLKNEKATGQAVLSNLTSLASKVNTHGTLFYYFGGHGGNQATWVEDRMLGTFEIREAIERGRESAGPLSRLVMIFDACHAGSNIGPLLPHPSLEVFTQSLDAESIAEEMLQGNRGSEYWDKLIVLASSHADELSWVGAQGHFFTVSMHKAFKTSMENNETIGEFLGRTTLGLTASHPTYKVVPADLMNEKMRP